jgi:hypothetical protein
VLFALAGVLMALRPPGVEGGPHREASDLGALMTTAVVLAVAGLAALPALEADRGGRWGQAGAVAALAGAAVGLLGGLGEAAGLDDLWMAVVLGLLAVQLASALLGVWALRSGRLPRAPAALLVASSLAFVVGFNTEDARALMGVPIGATWAWVGYLLWTGNGAPRLGGSPAA